MYVLIIVCNDDDKYILPFLKEEFEDIKGEFEPHSIEVYSIQHYVIKFVNDLRQVGGFLRVLWFSPPIKLGCNHIAEMLCKHTIFSMHLLKLILWGLQK
jgi:hypothetical protein